MSVDLHAELDNLRSMVDARDRHIVELRDQLTAEREECVEVAGELRARVDALRRIVVNTRSGWTLYRHKDKDGVRDLWDHEAHPMVPAGPLDYDISSALLEVPAPVVGEGGTTTTSARLDGARSSIGTPPSPTHPGGEAA